MPRWPRIRVAFHFSLSELIGSDRQIRVMRKKTAQEKDPISTNYSRLAQSVATELRMKLLSRTFSNTAIRRSVSSCVSLCAAGGADCGHADAIQFKLESRGMCPRAPFTCAFACPIVEAREHLSPRLPIHCHLFN